MKKQFMWALASVMSVGGFGYASAADLPLKARPLPVAAVYSWTGCYVGANIGGKWARTGDVVNIPAATGAAGASPASSADLGRLTTTGLVGGGQIGCDWQRDHLVFGIEGDADVQRWTHTVTIAGVPPLLFVPGDTFQLKSTWQASIRGRIGYAWDRNLIYATGGVAFTDVNAFTNWIAIGLFPQVIASQTKTFVGGTIGAGFEHAFTDNFTLGVEGRYTWYGDQTFDAGLLPVTTIRGVLFTSSPTTRSVSLNTAEVLLKANWKFTTFGGPVVAKY